ncbi:MAG: aspartate aminotransferase family protein, partial [Cyanobacteria bacterium]|nr:aspartate aminotransferase family protein [Cyanobacteriota bacterium]
AGGVATLERLSDPSVYEVLEKQTVRMVSGFEVALSEVAKRLDREIPVRIQRVGSMFAIMFTNRAVKNFTDSKTIDEARFARFFHEFLARGIMLPPTAVDAACVSFAHTDDDIDLTVTAFHDSVLKTFSTD